jgi:hypothetical protein
VLHRRLADAIAVKASVGDENAALIAEHLQAAGDSRAAYDWHMRAGAWLASRDIAGACLSWQRAWQVADMIAAVDPDAVALQIAPRSLWCANAWRIRAHIAGPRFDELEELCARAGDKASLAIGMAGLLVEGLGRGWIRDTARLAAEHLALVESIADPTLTIGLAPMTVGVAVVTGEIREVLRWSEIIIDLAHDDPVRGNYVIGSPLAMAYACRSVGRWCFALPGYREDAARAIEMGRSCDPWTRASVMFYAFGAGVTCGIYVLDAAARSEIDAALTTAESAGDDLAVAFGKYTLGLVLVHGDTADRERGLDVLTEVGELIRQGRFWASEAPVVQSYVARERARHGSADAVIGDMRAALDLLFERGQGGWSLAISGVYLETLLGRRDAGDLAEAEAVIGRMATAPVEMAPECRRMWLLRARAMLAHARGDEAGCRELRDEYRELAAALDFDGHLAWATAMT